MNLQQTFAVQRIGGALEGAMDRNEFVRNARKTPGLSQEGLADAMWVARETITRHERPGKTVPDRSIMQITELLERKGIRQ
jgi:ribosome-binding protein aMBF1 (putative translation factor)